MRKIEGSSMIKSKLLRMLLGILFATGLAGAAGADTWTVYADSGIIHADLNISPKTVDLFITPFDSTLGTLNSVTMYAEVGTTGIVTAHYYALDPAEATLTYSSKTTLAVLEMGNTAVTDGGSATMFGAWDEFSGSMTVATTNKNTTSTNMLSSGFGRFAGPDPFPVPVTLVGLASSTDPTMTDVYFNFDGYASYITIDYDYTPAGAVPLPGAVLLLGAGLGRLAMYRRRKMNAKN
jgi:hypothetical protein